MWDYGFMKNVVITSAFVFILLMDVWGYRLLGREAGQVGEKEAPRGEGTRGGSGIVTMEAAGDCRFL